MPKKHVDEIQEVEVDGHQFELKNLSKVLYPEVGYTKAQVINYYSRIAEVMLPHLRERAVTLKRYPHGVDDMFFFEKNAPSYAPSWLKTTDRYSESSDRTIHYALVNDLASLVWLVNQATIEFHVPMAMRRSPSRPRAIVFDLDPGPGMDAADCARVALMMRRRLKHDELDSWIKSSGSKGLHLYVPLNRPRMTFERTKKYAHKVADDLVDALPDVVVSRMAKKLRNERVFIDWSQNSTNKTTVCAYSLRARERPYASAPLSWDEVTAAAEADDGASLLCSADDVLERVSQDGDLFAGVLDTEQTLPRA